TEPAVTSDGAVAFATTPATAQEYSDLEDSFIIRDGELLHIDFAKLLRQGDLAQNIYLRPGDVIYVRAGTSRGDIYVLGAVAQPNIVEYHENITLLSAIANVGGPVPYARLSHIAIVRGSLVHPAIAVFEYNKIVKGGALD